MHGLKAFRECERVECPSCLRYIERHPITEKDRSKWISKIGAATKRPRPVQHPSATSYNLRSGLNAPRAFVISSATRSPRRTGASGYRRLERPRRDRAPFNTPPQRHTTSDLG